MDKLIALCKENNVTFIAATMPIPAVTLSENWDSFEAADTYFSDYFKAQGVPYYNFNMEYYSAYSHDGSRPICCPSPYESLSVPPAELLPASCSSWLSPAP